MKALIQRVNSANVAVDEKIIGQIGKGFLIFLGVENNDTEQLAEKLAEKILKYRICADDSGKMNVNVTQIHGQILVISQFTLVADTKKGNRPGFSRGAPPELGKHLYEVFLKHIERQYQAAESGKFGADMQVTLTNDGPVTFLLETHA